MLVFLRGWLALAESKDSGWEDLGTENISEGLEQVAENTRSQLLGNSGMMTLEHIGMDTMGQDLRPDRVISTHVPELWRGVTEPRRCQEDACPEQNE